MQRDALVKRVCSPEELARLQQRLTQEESITLDQLIMDLDSQVEPSKKQLAEIKQSQALSYWEEDDENFYFPLQQPRKRDSDILQERLKGTGT